MKTALRQRVLFLACALPLALAGGCSSLSGVFDEDEPALEGERISVLELAESLEPDSAALEAEGLVAPPVWKNEFWPQAGGYPNHSMQNLELRDGNLQKAWSADIGAGTTDELPLTAQPIIVDGRVFTLDTESRLSAFDTATGKLIWAQDVGNPEEDDAVIGGGMASAAGMLYVTNGYNEVLALQPANGKILWRAPIPAPSRAAPTVMDGRLFVITLDNRLVALSAADGKPLWEYQGLSETAGIIGAASAAADATMVIPAFSSGEIMALRVENGSLAWSDNLANLKRIGGLAGLSDIKALPVIDKGLVIGVSYSGRMVAIDSRTGTRVWQREISSANTPWIAGNHIFVLSTENQLVAMGRDTGVIRWVINLARNDDGEPVIYTGPVLAGGRLILAGTGGRVLELNAENGAVLRQWTTDNSVAISPVIAGGTLYLLSEDGTLSAYR